MKYEIRELLGEPSDAPSLDFRFGLSIIWDYENPEQANDQWHTSIVFKDWLVNQFQLNRGYRYQRWNEMYHYVYFTKREDAMLFKLTFA